MEDRGFTKEEIETEEGLCRAVARILSRHGYVHFVEDVDLRKRMTENAWYVETVLRDNLYKPFAIAERSYHDAGDEIEKIQTELKEIAAEIGANCFFTNTSFAATDYYTYSKVIATPYIIIGRNELKSLEKVYPDGLPYELYREIGDRYDSAIVKLDVVDLYGKARKAGRLAGRAIHRHSEGVH